MIYVHTYPFVYLCILLNKNTYTQRLKMSLSYILNRRAMPAHTRLNRLWMQGGDGKRTMNGLIKWRQSEDWPRSHTARTIKPSAALTSSH